MIPENAKRDCRPIRIDAADKKKRGKGMNFRERAAFSGICKFGPEQLIECHGDEVWEGDYQNAYDFSVMCAKCPHCVSSYFGVRHRPLYDQFAAGSCFDGHVVYDKLEEHMEMDDPKAFVYFVDDGEYIKIGRAKNIRSRVSSLQTGNARTLTVLYAVPCKSDFNSLQVERFLHLIYERYRMEGEWFNIREKIDPISFSIFKPEQEWI